MTEAQQQVQNFYHLLLEGKTEALLSMFAGDAAIDTPLQGKVIGKEQFEEYVREQQVWLKQHEAKPEFLALISTADRIIAEFVLYLQQNDRAIDLPVGIVADLANNAVFALRVYHSTWPLTGKHIVRAPLLDVTENLEEPKIIEQYMIGIAEPDKEALLALFVEDGYVREPSGSRYKYQGEERRRAFYDMVLAEGPVPLKHCTATFDGKRFAVEYVCDRWGRVQFPPQAGMSVYELAESGRLLAVRIYDDVSPPNEAIVQKTS